MPEIPSFESPSEKKSTLEESVSRKATVSRRRILQYLAGGAALGAAGLVVPYFSQGEPKGQPENNEERIKVAIGNFIETRNNEYLSKLTIDIKHEMILRSAASHGCFLTNEGMRSGFFVRRKLKNGEDVTLGLVRDMGSDEERGSELVAILEQYGVVPEPPEPEDQYEIHKELLPHLDELKYGYTRAGWEKDDVALAVKKAANFDPSWRVRVHQWGANPLKNPRGIYGSTVIRPDTDVIQGWLDVGKWGLDFEVDLSGKKVTISSERHHGPASVFEASGIRAGVQEYVHMLEEKEAKNRK